MGGDTAGLVYVAKLIQMVSVACILKDQQDKNDIGLIRVTPYLKMMSSHTQSYFLWFCNLTAIVFAKGMFSNIRSVRSLNVGNDAIYFIVNGSKSVTAEPKMDLMFYCYMTGDTPLRGLVTSYGNGQMEDRYFDQGSIQFTLSNLTCQDGGQYTCTTVDASGQSQLRSTVNVSVKCAPTMRYPQSPRQTRFIQTSPKIDTVLLFEVYTYPEISQYELQYQHGATWVSVDRGMYSATYSAGGVSSGWVTLVIYDLTFENTTVYRLIMSNSMGSLEHRITVRKSFPQDNESGDYMWLGIGLGICCGIVLVIVMVTCVFFIRGRRRGDLQSEITLSSDENFNLKKKEDSMYQSQQLDMYRPTHTDLMTAL
ncbi:hypothetical protein Btru_055119 [Bulinus truncatus]|nr:hypothetical protein Btru_055119 [Bulinus truncatus]